MIGAATGNSVEGLRKTARALAQAGALVAGPLMDGKPLGRWIADATREQLQTAITTGVAGKVDADFVVVDPSNEPEPVPVAAPEPRRASNATGNGSKAATLEALIKDIAGEAVNRGEVEEIARQIAHELDQELAANILESVKGAIDQAGAKVRPIRVEIPGRAPVDLGRQHKCFEPLIKTLGAGCHCFVVGPAGSGKTHGAEYAAKGLGLEFYPKSCGPEMSAFDLLGYMDATGKYVPGLLREPFERGGLLCLDEIDRGNPAVLTTLNSALANDYCSFPDGVIKRHESFRVVACANTWGTGADSNYVGATQLDAASLNRFVYLAWPYDEELEASFTDNRQWFERVLKVRRAVESLKVRAVVSPRATIYGTRLLAAGFKLPEVEAMVLWAGMDAATIDKVKGAAL